MRIMCWLLAHRMHYTVHAARLRAAAIPPTGALLLCDANSGRASELSYKYRVDTTALQMRFD